MKAGRRSKGSKTEPQPQPGSDAWVQYVIWWCKTFLWTREFVWQQYERQVVALDVLRFIEEEQGAEYARALLRR